MKKALTILLFFLFIFTVVEATLRLYTVIRWSVPYFKPYDIIYNFYPEAEPLRNTKVSNADDVLDILVLSCSVLHSEWGDFGSAFMDGFQMPDKYERLEIHNLSGIGHGSLDNLNKYNLIGNNTFDIVIYYDAINDARLNNCPEEVYQSDFTHYEWYDEISVVLRHRRMNYSVIPFYFDYMFSKLSALFNNDRYIPIHYSKRPNWLTFGRALKSFNQHVKNVESIIDDVIIKGSTFVYISFLYYLPENYTLKAFEDQSLDYKFCKNSRETEIWGLPENVVSFIDSANFYMEQQLPLRQSSSIHYYNAENEFQQIGDNFADICHFSDLGMSRFGDVIANYIEQTLEE